MNQARRVAIALNLLALLIDCSREQPPPLDCNVTHTCSSLPASEPVNPRFYADPPYGLGFSCIALGCDETLVLSLRNRGGGSLVLTRIRFGQTTSSDFEMQILEDAQASDPVVLPMPSNTTPITIKANSKIDVRVHYKPTDALSDQGSIEVRYYDGAVAFDAAVMQDVSLSIYARSLGSAKARLNTPQLRFGYVAANAEATAHVDVENMAVDDAILAVTNLNVGSLPLQFSVQPGFVNVSNSGDKVQIPIIFHPEQEGSFRGQMSFDTNDLASPHFIVDILGSSIAGARLEMTQPNIGIIELGRLRVGSQALLDVKVRNIGAQAITPIPKIVSGHEAGLSIIATPQSLSLFDEMTFTLQLITATSGPITGQMDLGDGTLIAVKAFGLSPKLEYAPNVTDFGTVILGAPAVMQKIVLRNTGTGDLTITGIAIENDTRVRINNQPSLPVLLHSPNDILNIETFVNGNTPGAIDATLVVHSDSISGDTARVAIVGRVASCEEGCPVTHGTPQCTQGVCAIGRCNDGWHDVDGRWNNGCECQDEGHGQDVGGTCSTGTNIGGLGDSCDGHPSEVQVTGVLAGLNDVDLYYGRTYDGSCTDDWFSDSAATSVTLVDGPPGLALCAQIRSSGSGCGGYTLAFDATVCGQPKYARGGSVGAEDGRALTAWVLWRPGAAPSCAAYRLKFRGRN
jgi:hypothetical protein